MERLQGAKAAKARAEGYVGGARLHPRFGYGLREGPDGRREYEPVPEEQATIGEMRRLREKGMSLAAVCAALEDQGRSAPTGGGWSEPTVLRILRREAGGISAS